LSCKAARLRSPIAALCGAAQCGRFDCRRDFAYGRDWNGKFYATKQVRPIFVEETEEIVVVTVYVYYL
jgi:hypothetical protein